MNESEFLTWMQALIKTNGNREITGIILQNVITTMAQNVIWKDSIPFDFDSVTIDNDDLNVDKEYTHNHGLDCDEPVYIITWIDAKQVRGDGYFDVERVDSDNQLFTFHDAIPTGSITITAFKFKAAS